MFEGWEKLYIGLRKNGGIAWVWTDSKDEITYSSLWLPGEPAGGSFCAVTSTVWFKRNRQL